MDTDLQPLAPHLTGNVVKRSSHSPTESGIDRPDAIQTAGAVRSGRQSTQNAATVHSYERWTRDQQTIDSPPRSADAPRLCSRKHGRKLVLPVMTPLDVAANGCSERLAIRAIQTETRAKHTAQY